MQKADFVHRGPGDGRAASGGAAGLEGRAVARVLEREMVKKPILDCLEVGCWEAGVRQEPVSSMKPQVASSVEGCLPAIAAG